ncbi:MAG TPA: metallophosphoesterase [Candidatus Tectomicrobia bacterium]|jgi:3',5'-cyclic AMP phosphodiesterase CpdA
MSMVLQVSDTHFGTEQSGVVEALLRLVRAQHPDMVVLSGDITQRARRSQFRAARTFVERLAVPDTLVLPGNHDIPLFNVLARLVAPYANHQRVFGAELEPECESADVLVIGVNTTRPSRHKDGAVSAAQIARVSRRLRCASATQLRIVVTHQPVHVTRPEDETHVLHGHRKAVYAWADAGVDLILGGHIHLPYVRPLRERFIDLPRSVWAVQAGTAVSSRVRDGIPNSVNLIRYAGTERPRRCVVERWDHDVVRQHFVLVDRIELHLDTLPA